MRQQWRSASLLLLAVVVGTVLLGGSIPSVTTPLDTPLEQTPSTVDLDSGELRLWPYVADARSFDRPASSINVVFYGDADRVRDLLTRTGTWNESEADPQANVTDRDTVGGVPVVWTDISSAPRFTYVDDGGTGRWIAPSYQLHHGDYLGQQHHLRVYELGGDRVAVQAHTEHWDWLLLTHVVDSLQVARLQVEDGFIGRPYTGDVRRVYYDNGDTYDADGWATVVRLAFVLPVIGAASLRSRTTGLDTPTNRRRVGLAASLVLVVLGVRVLGIAVERAFPIPVDTVALLLYPSLAAGLPVAAYLWSRRLPAVDAFAIAAVAVGVAVRLDYSILAISVIPIEVVVHRATAAVAVGLIAAGAGAATRDTGNRNALVTGAGLWLAVLLAAVF